MADRGVGSAEPLPSRGGAFAFFARWLWEGQLCVGEWLVCTLSCWLFEMLWLCWALESQSVHGWLRRSPSGPGCRDAATPGLSPTSTLPGDNP